MYGCYVTNWPSSVADLSGMWSSASRLKTAAELMIAVAGTSRRAMRERCTSMRDSNTNKPDLTQWSNPRPSYCDFSVWPYNLEHCVTSCAQLWDNFHQIKFDLRQLIRAWIIAFLMLICYVTLWPWPLTLNAHGTSSIMWSKSVQNLSEIEKSRTEIDNFANFCTRYVTLSSLDLELL